MARKFVSGLCLFSIIAFFFNYAAAGLFGVISFGLKLFSDMFGVVFLMTSIGLIYTNPNQAAVSEKAKLGITIFIIMCSLVAIIGLTGDLRDLAQGPRTVETNVYECETTNNRGMYNYYVHLNNSFRKIKVSSGDYERLCVKGHTVKVRFYEHTRLALDVEIL